MPRYSPSTGALSTYQVGPYDIEHWYLQWGGKLPGGESWSCGLRLAPTGVFAPEVSQAACDAAAAAVSTYHSSPTIYVSSLAKLSIVKLNRVDTTGHQGENNSVQTLVADVGGGGAGAMVANQLALAVTLTTGFSRGLGHAGRYYLPMPGVTPGADGRIAADQADGVSDTSDTFITALNAISAQMEVSVMSRKAGSPGHRRVTGNRVGRVLDTQRRRRRSLIEDYQ